MSSSPDPSSPVRRTPFAEGACPIIIAVFTAILMFGPIPTISAFVFAYVWHHWTTLGVISSKIDFLDQLLDSVDLMMVDQTRMTLPEASGLFLDTFKDERRRRVPFFYSELLAQSLTVLQMPHPALGSTKPVQRNLVFGLAESEGARDTR